MGTVIRPEVSSKNKYWLPKHRYYELKHFCLQYPDWKKNYISLDGMPSKAPESSNRSSNRYHSDPTEVYAEARIFYRDRMDMVEDTAKTASEDLSALLLKAVTEGLSYDMISPPCCKEVWYVLYRRFFWLLDKARK